MRGSIHRLLVPVTVLGALVLLAGCSGARIADPTGTNALLPVSGSASDGLAASLPPPVVTRLQEGGVVSRPEFVPTADENVPPSWSTPAPVGTPYATAAAGSPAPPPPPTTAGGGVPTVRYASPAPTSYAAAPVAPTPLTQRCWSGCGLPCEDGVSSWHARVVGGWPLYSGTDSPEGCSYWGVDLGRTHCGCWGYDLYYRMSGAKFDREGYPDDITEDGGLTNHLGGKLTWENSFGRSRFYYWVGAGAGYFWTTDYQDDDDGFEVFGEFGLGYVLSERFRLRAGLNVHGADTSTGRKQFAEQGVGRWLWLIAPVVELQVDF